MRLHWNLQPTWQPFWELAWLAWILQIPPAAWDSGAPCKYHGSSTIYHQTQTLSPNPIGNPCPYLKLSQVHVI